MPCLPEMRSSESTTKDSIWARGTPPSPSVELLPQGHDLLLEGADRRRRALRTADREALERSIVAVSQIG